MQQFCTLMGKLVVVCAVWLAIGWLTGFLRPLDSSLGTQLPDWSRLPGCALIVIGGTGVLVCGALLSTRGIGTLPGPERFMPREFVAGGPFRFVRNPMSLFAVVLMGGIGLQRRSTLGLVLTVAFWVFLHAVIVRKEEPGLEKRFGEGYRLYKRNVPRWIPRWRPWVGGDVEPRVAPNGGSGEPFRNSNAGGGQPLVS